MKEMRQKEDYRIITTIKSNKSIIDGVLCKVFLPKRLTEPVELYFYPDEEQRHKLEKMFEFSITGEVKGFSGELESRIQADKVYFKTGSTTYWGQGIAESIFTGDPIDLKVIDFLQRDDKALVQKIMGSLWLTPSMPLSPFKTRERSYKGDVKVETIRQVKFTLANGLSLTFDKHFRYVENENGDEITFSELVAEFETDRELQGIENELIDDIDDFLMLVSFAERQRCVCLGWDFMDSKEHTKYYRRDVAIPETREKQNLFETLIDVSDFEDFIKQAYDKFIKIESKDLIRQAIQYTTSVHQGNKTLENEFLSLYAALETLVLYFRRIHHMEDVLPPELWKQLRGDLEKWLKVHPLLSSDKNKRALIYKKLSELNRIPFSIAFDQLCEVYSIDLSDIWSVTADDSMDVSLSEIRNKLVHGDVFNPPQFRALMAAKEHLLWSMERLILAVLGWPISRSTVNRDFLSRNMACYQEWKEDQKILSG